MAKREGMAADIEIKRSLTAAILDRMAHDGISITTLAERMGTRRTAVRRILDEENTSITFRSMSRAAQAVGLKIKLVAEPMTPRELGNLARQLATTKGKAESSRLAKQITRGFYAGA